MTNDGSGESERSDRQTKAKGTHGNGEGGCGKQGEGVAVTGGPREVARARGSQPPAVVEAGERIGHRRVHEFHIELRVAPRGCGHMRKERSRLELASAELVCTEAPAVDDPELVLGGHQRYQQQ